MTRGGRLCSTKVLTVQENFQVFLAKQCKILYSFVHLLGLKTYNFAFCCFNACLSYVPRSHFNFAVYHF